MSADFKLKDTKRAARESDKTRRNDKKSSLKAKRAARMSADFFTKERCAKREFKQKELGLRREKVKENARLYPYILEEERVTTIMHL